MAAGYAPTERSVDVPCTEGFRSTHFDPAVDKVHLDAEASLCDVLRKLPVNELLAKGAERRAADPIAYPFDSTFSMEVLTLDRHDGMTPAQISAAQNWVMEVEAWRRYDAILRKHLDAYLNTNFHGQTGQRARALYIIETTHRAMFRNTHRGIRARTPVPIDWHAGRGSHAQPKEHDPTVLHDAAPAAKDAAPRVAKRAPPPKREKTPPGEIMRDMYDGSMLDEHGSIVEPAVVGYSVRLTESGSIAEIVGDGEVQSTRRVSMRPRGVRPALSLGDVEEDA